MASESQPSLGQIAQNLFETALQNILHETILTQHREHKLMIGNLDSTTKLPHCDRCKLPRLLDPPLAPKVRGATSDPPKDTQYCDRKPWSRRPGHDIYDNPFLKADSTGRPPTKKEREAAAKNKKNAADGDGTPVSEEQNQNGTGPPSPSENGEQGSNDPGRKLEKGEKKASKIDEKLKKGEYIPWHTCPSCKRSLLITRFAKHLEQCMGLSGRQASRNAMAKMSSTPSASRAGTPQPANSQDGGGGKGEEDDEDDIAVKASASVAGGPNMKKKLLKKGLNQKIKKERNSATNSHSSSSGKLSKPSTMTGKKPGSANKASSPGNGHGAGGGSSGEKRDRDEMSRDDNDDDGPGDDDDEESVVHVKKRQKLERVGSTASLGSQSTAAGGGGLAGLEREESRDGSFVDEGSVGED
ncbi:hypothetical protein KC332_g17662 [Hortaea werneckii]|uniref:SAGA-associated factor 11 n=2 Tax=Hortaea werneckii TaxID=91943 RepID=A0A3M7I036_HORWE|nr:hypothetical protein KC358_g17804 [Hortaea werneckii]OTA32711.1 hypothetical protein BTJ68_08897 [Hortaea werneckii EXF-2000]KAI6791616.1 hypothetical protein KC350_g17789 [Hortaea werneckii]KAI6897423.1 hypothetical protein KC348_g17746 [Hortaea werneckii]KAI6918533.1 hypothetical protein KC341_g17837 [Hortaea werneckii]